MKRAALLLLFLAGVWSGSTVFMWQVAIQNFAVAESVSASSNKGLSDAVQGLSDEGLLSALRYQASEVNRLFFRGWGWVQLPIAALALFLTRVARCGDRRVGHGRPDAPHLYWACGVCRPETVRLGRLIDFGAESSLPDVPSAFWALHHTYTALGHAEVRDGVELGRPSLAPRKR